MVFGDICLFSNLTLGILFAEVKLGHNSNDNRELTKNIFMLHCDKVSYIILQKGQQCKFLKFKLSIVG